MLGTAKSGTFFLKLLSRALSCLTGLLGCRPRARWPRRPLSKAASLKKHVTNVESLALWLRNRIGRKGKTAGQLPAREAERRGTGPRRGLRVYRPELS